MPFANPVVAKAYYKAWYKKNGKAQRIKRREYTKQWELSHKDEMKKLRRQWQIDNREHLNEWTRNNRKENHTEKLEYRRKWKEEHRELINKQQREWRKANPMLQKAYSYRRRGAGTLDKETVQRVYEDNIKKYGTLHCVLCNKQIAFGEDSLEHLQPLTKGGSNLYENLAIAHLKCNIQKKNRTIEEWRMLNGKT